MQGVTRALPSGYSSPILASGTPARRTSPVRIMTAIHASAESNPYVQMTQRLDQATGLLDLDPGMAAILAEPAHELSVSIPVQMDNGTVRVFTGYRVQHSIARGSQ